MIADSRPQREIVEAIQAGADDFMRRPYTAEDLENAIKGVAGRAARGAASAGGDENGARLERELALLISPQMREVQRRHRAGRPAPTSPC